MERDGGGTNEAEAVVASVLAARSHYACLGLPEEWLDDPRRVRRHYRERARRVHPDKCHHPDAPRAFRALTQALECLVDPQLQSAHLASLRRSPTQSEFSSSSASSASASSSAEGWYRAGPKSSFRQSEFAHAYAEAMHAARRRAREQQQRQQQEEAQHRKRKAEAEEQARARDEEEDEDYVFASQQQRQKQRQRQGETENEAKRARTSRSVPFDYATLNTDRKPTPPRPARSSPQTSTPGAQPTRARERGHARQEDAGDKERRAEDAREEEEERPTTTQADQAGKKEEEKRQRATSENRGRGSTEFVCEECGRRFPSQTTYDRHQLFGGFNHRYRRNKASSSSPSPSSSSSRASAPMY